MRVLSNEDLRWVSGGLCSFGNADHQDISWALTDYGIAQGEVVSALVFLGQQTPGTPEHWDASRAYDDAIMAANAASTYYQLQMDSQFNCQIANSCYE